MATYAVLLRGVNVGGHRKVPMARLREALEAAGFDRVRTYIQSGNIVLDSHRDAGEVGEAVAAVILEAFGHTVPVMVRSAAEMDRIAASDPFAGRGLDESKVTVAFLSAPAPALAVPAGRPEEAHVRGREVWVYYPEGLGASTLDRSGFWKPLGAVQSTVRNLRTVRRLRDMTARTPE
ncbi:DUF1697 domain-containing protein [Glycomyces tritici]|uniref:DUF1697 domain-containing protein n=1 Tax=Glycomyces tritici TaxID=2665176 RepID=A0ABT7YVX0_9ACTN|nr:DUF1697 domain-containing protein [Glycomyces tritici]MDN3242786.1 DUF1697 domain-containing protein [Glycomyces tritici]